MQRYLTIFILNFLYLLFSGTLGYAQEKQQLLMSGAYHVNTQETPLYYIPQSVFRHYSNSVLHIQTVPFQELQEWGTQSAIVSCDSINGKPVNSIVFLNAQIDTSAGAGFVNRQTEPLYFRKTDSTMQLIPTYGKNPLEYSQNGTFNFQGNWFSLYRYPHIENSEWKDVQDERKTVYGTTLNIEAAAFDLFRPVPFKQIIYNNTTDSIPLYVRTDTLARPKKWFQANENLFVYKDSLDGLWLKVSHFELTPHERQYPTTFGVHPLHYQLKERTGWVQKEDLYRKQWEQHLAELPGFRFEVAGVDPNIGNEYYTRGMLAAVKVIDKENGRTVQVITDIGAEITDTLNQCLHFVDANFDGYPDIIADFADGGGGPNYTYIFYIFDPISKQFVYDEDLSALPQVEVDTVHQLIRSGWRSGAGQHGAAEYRFINGKMQQTYQWDQVWGAGYFVEETETVRQPDGQWKETISYGAEPVAETVAIYRKPNEKHQLIAHVKGATTYFKILGENALWYSVQSAYPDTLLGWVRKEVFFPDRWKVVPTDFISYEFEKTEDEYGNLLALRIRDKKSRKPLQIIGLTGSGYRSAVLETGDYNRDGQTDFRIRFADEEMEPVVYVFNKRRKLFVKEGN